MHYGLLKLMKIVLCKNAFSLKYEMKEGKILLDSFELNIISSLINASLESNYTNGRGKETEKIVLETIF